MKSTQYAYPFYLILSGIGAWIFYNRPEQFNQFLIIAGVILLLFYRLTLVVTPEYIQLILGVGLFRKKFYEKDIVGIKLTTFFTLGWGIRFQKDKTIYSVSGNKGIEISLKNSEKKIILGCNNPDDLIRFLKE